MKDISFPDFIVLKICNDIEKMEDRAYAYQSKSLNLLNFDITETILAI